MQNMLLMSFIIMLQLHLIWFQDPILKISSMTPVNRGTYHENEIAIMFKLQLKYFSLHHLSHHSDHKEKAGHISKSGFAENCAVWGGVPDILFHDLAHLAKANCTQSWTYLHDGFHQIWYLIEIMYVGEASGEWVHWLVLVVTKLPNQLLHVEYTKEVMHFWIYPKFPLHNTYLMDTPHHNVWLKRQHKNWPVR